MDMSDLVAQMLAERERDLSAMREIVRERSAMRCLNWTAGYLAGAFDRTSTVKGFEQTKDEIVEAMVDGLVRWARERGWEPDE